MKTRADARLREEAARFALRFACDDCAHFAHAEARCAHGYPPEPRRDAIDRDPFVVFCKEFELS
jgi:hypothetical protein